MIRLLEVIVALIIVAVLGVLFGYTLPSHRHIERSTGLLGTPNSTIPILPPGFTTRASSRMVAAGSST